MVHTGSDGIESRVAVFHNPRRCGRLRVASLVSLSLAMLLAPGEAAPRRPLPTEPLEKYEDAPVHIFRLGVSPRMLSQFGAFMSYQVNVDGNGNNITGDAANEPSITVDPTNHNRMAIGWRQFD